MASPSEIMANWLEKEADKLCWLYLLFLCLWRLVAVSRYGSSSGLVSVGLSVASPHYYCHIPSSLPTFMYIDALVYSSSKSNGRSGVKTPKVPLCENLSNFKEHIRSQNVRWIVKEAETFFSNHHCLDVLDGMLTPFKSIPFDPIPMPMTQPIPEFRKTRCRTWPQLESFPPQPRFPLWIARSCPSPSSPIDHPLSSPSQPSGLLFPRPWPPYSGGQATSPDSRGEPQNASAALEQPLYEPTRHDCPP